MATRKLLITKNGFPLIKKESGDFHVTCPIKRPAEAYQDAHCDTDCAWFSTFENDVYCRHDRIGVLNDEG